MYGIAHYETHQPHGHSSRRRGAGAEQPEHSPGYYDTSPALVLDRLRGSEPGGIEGAIGFLEADPYFFRSGYLKARLIRSLKRPMLTPEYAERLRRVVLALVEKRYDRDFRAFCTLAHKVDAPELREQLTRRLGYDDPHVRRRARWVLEALGQKVPQD